MCHRTRQPKGPAVRTVGASARPKGRPTGLVGGCESARCWGAGCRQPSRERGLSMGMTRQNAQDHEMNVLHLQSCLRCNPGCTPPDNGANALRHNSHVGAPRHACPAVTGYNGWGHPPGAGAQRQKASASRRTGRSTSNPQPWASSVRCREGTRSARLARVTVRASTRHHTPHPDRGSAHPHSPAAVGRSAGTLACLH